MDWLFCLFKDFFCGSYGRFFLKVIFAVRILWVGFLQVIFVVLQGVFLKIEDFKILGIMFHFCGLSKPGCFEHV